MICLIRHAKTRGNTERRYIGRTDEAICETESLNRSYPRADIVVTSALKRAVMTAEVIYPNIGTIKDARLNECDFGAFEGRNFDELKDVPQYIKWLESGGTIPFPDGESRSRFSERCAAAFFEYTERLRGKNIAFVVHGGTVMAVMERLFGGGFYDYQAENGGGFIITEENGKWLSYTTL